MTRVNFNLFAWSALLVAVLVAASIPAQAAIEHRNFASDQDRELYVELIRELRCLVCQNQNLAESNAGLAKDLRNKTYQLIGEGKERSEIVEYMVQRYGDFVLYRPPFKLNTAILWLGPLVLLLLGVWTLVFIARRPTSSPDPIDPIPDSGVNIDTARALLDNLDNADAPVSRTDPTQVNKQ